MEWFINPSWRNDMDAQAPHQLIVNITIDTFELNEKGECMPPPKTSEKKLLSFYCKNFQESQEKYEQFMNKVFTDE